jgi:hypothetical protein
MYVGVCVYYSVLYRYVHVHLGFYQPSSILVSITVLQLSPMVPVELLRPPYTKKQRRGKKTN